jgi:hypothetical protein
MKARAGGERGSTLAARSTFVAFAAAFAALPLLLAWTSPSSRAPAQEKARGKDDPEEAFEAVDPYTRGEKEALAALGEISFGPFPWSEGKSTADVRQSLGNPPILWVETAHFKIGSALPTYRIQSDKREKEALSAELELLKGKLPRLKPQRKELDPWLRLHLCAQRAEAVYADFCKQFSLREDEFGPKTKMGSGPYLGMKSKFAVLLASKRSMLGRYTQETFGGTFDHNYRYPLPGGGMFFGLSSQALAENTPGLDNAIHCALANGLAQNFVAGFRDSSYAAPMWFREGLGHWFSRRVDPRWPLLGGGTESSGQRDENDWNWAVRVRNLVEQGVYSPWAEMLTWSKPEDISQRMHMIVWSRVDFLMQRKGSDLRAWLLGVTERQILLAPEEMAKIQLEKQTKALLAGFGTDAATLDEEWKAWVLKTYPKK